MRNFTIHEPHPLKTECSIPSNDSFPKHLANSLTSESTWWTAQDPGAEHRPLVLTPKAGQELSAAWVCSSSTAGKEAEIPDLPHWQGNKSQEVKFPLARPKRSTSLEGFNAAFLYFSQCFTLFAWSIFYPLVQQGVGEASCACSPWQGLMMVTGINPEGASPSSIHLLQNWYDFWLQNYAEQYRKIMLNYLITFINSWKLLRKQN